MVIDGKACAAKINLKTKSSVEVLRKRYDIEPCLAVILVGEDPASQVYVRSKVRQAKESGIRSIEYRLPDETPAAALLKMIGELNSDPSVNGILVQLPLPEHIDESVVLEAIAPEKDVDGFHAVNSGRLLSGDPRALVPCTPQGCVILAKEALGPSLGGKHAVVIGRSNIVGKPLAVLLLQENCTVSVVHSRTSDIQSITRLADILFVAVGRPELVEASWIKPGATVIDVGINRVEASEGAYRLTGDVNYVSAATQAGAITPVPGGVGPMTIACLLRNTLMAACIQHAIEHAGL